eukprot:8097921-Pyramimonas_sp.AAC.1
MSKKSTRALVAALAYSTTSGSAGENTTHVGDPSEENTGATCRGESVAPVGSRVTPPPPRPPSSTTWNTSRRSTHAATTLSACVLLDTSASSAWGRPASC